MEGLHLYRQVTFLFITSEIRRRDILKLCTVKKPAKLFYL